MWNECRRRGYLYRYMRIYLRNVKHMNYNVLLRKASPNLDNPWNDLWIPEKSFSVLFVWKQRREKLSMLQINELVFSNINDALMTIEAVIFLTIVQLRYFIDNNKCFNTKTNPILLSTNPYVVEI